MLRVFLDGLVKRYRQVAAVDGATLDLHPGELTCLLGPRGAGKSTLARLIAGLETPDDGEIYFNERLVLDVPPQDRRVGMVFPDLALWPGLSIVDNVAHALRVRGISRSESRDRSKEILTRLRIDSLAGKRPEQLSHAQALRVALARAIVNEPDLLILDEPLEGFDDRGRAEAWDEIRRLRQDLGVTTLLLTRIVSEALANADRLAVMDLGRIIQCGAPQDVYNRPIDVFVARFLGPTNLLQGQVDSLGNESRREVVVRTPLGRLVAKIATSAPLLAAGTPVTISIRPETLSRNATVPNEWNRFPATIERIVFRGEIRQVELRGPGDWPVTAHLIQSQSADLREGQIVTLSVAPDFVTLLPGKFSVGSVG